MNTYHSVDHSYEKGGIVYSAFQRKEIVEMTIVTDKNGVERQYVTKIIGHWKDYEEARRQVELFNKKQHENISNR